MRYNFFHLYITAAVMWLCCACTEETTSPGGQGSAAGSIIQVGAEIENVPVVATTRAGAETKDAETVDWLVQPLMQGLDITYGKILSNGTHDDVTKRVAILKLLAKEDGSTSPYIYGIDPNSGYAKYSFNYRAVNGAPTTNPALWYDNGYHFFEGVHVPNRIRYTNNLDEIATNNRQINGESVAAVTNLTTDQHDDAHTGTDDELGNYTLLEHYLGMPANTRIAATVARIKLPFRHRLCRVLAYILIDPDIKTNGVSAKIKGYANVETDQSKPFRDDPTTSSIRFCNVDVLGGVHDVYNQTTQLHTLTPVWQEKVRKVVPHFQEELATFKTKEKDDKIWFENSSNYSSAPSTAIEKTYNNVPVYDLIVRPTYTSVDSVMYDEDLGGLTKQQYAAKTNQIDFTVSLDNGLTYEKHVTIDLDANYQTIIYLRITHEGVDYNESGSERWVERTHNDQWYGVDNQNDNTLSKTGSSWQRAYYNRDLSNSTGDDKITDGGFYDEDTPGEDGTKGQYISTDTWKEYFLQAFEGGEHHGDYFVLANDVTIDASLLPSDGLIFTGHLDGFNTHYERAYHTITLQHASDILECNETVTDVLAKLYEDAAATHPVPDLYWMSEVAQKPALRAPSTIPVGEPIAFDMNKTYPKDLEGLAIFYKEGGTYHVYTNRTFYKKAPGFLFAGLDGIYTTVQETVGDPYAKDSEGNPLVIWEANVHKEGNYWLPYRDVTGANATNTGWRAEVLNLTVEGGTLFKEDAVITGNVENCKDASGRVADHTPAMPKYK